MGSTDVARGRAWALVVGCVLGACTAPPPVEPDAGPVDGTCRSDGDCDDLAFCNGAEACLPADPAADARGCVHPDPPCEASQACLESEDRCVTSCAVEDDADGDGARARECGGIDCDDADARRFPGNVEACDDADRDEDCDASTFGDRDADGDGHADAQCCNADPLDGTRRCGDDCDDRRRDARPGNTEACEGIDNDCDGAIDEGLLVAQYRDEDLDLHGVAGARTDACPGAPGFSTAGDDCDDGDPRRHGAQLEICDGVDNDCDGASDEAPVAVPWYLDEDDDGFGAPPDDPATVVVSCAPIEGHSTRSSDCDDRDAAIRPGAREICNGRDDDCNGRADAIGSTGDGEDDDGDGHADRSCGGGDCDDASEAVYMRAPELCDGADNDCDGVVDGASAMALWYVDADGDGFGDTSPGAPAPIESCDPQPLRVSRGGDCDDGSASVRPRLRDDCDGVDADCDGAIDENGIRFAFFPDADRDGWGSAEPASIAFRCTGPSGTVTTTGDCADTDPTRHPQAAEQCQSIDDDCDGTIDEDSSRGWYLDVDGDGHGAGTALVACMPPAGRVAVGDDCDDGDAGLFPGNPETCDGADDDCDGTADDGAGPGCARDRATGTCTSGACVLTCEAGFADCDGLLATGCEVDIRRSASFCGSCTTRCGPGDSCGTATAGSCDASPVVALGGFGETTLAIRATGGVAAWGGAGSFLSTFSTERHTPQSTSLTDVVEVAAALEHACARTNGGRVLCWGANVYGFLGDGTTASRPSPRAVALADVVDVAVGRYHSCAVRRDGTVHCWGGGGTGGQLGTGDMMDRLVPTQVPGITDAVEVYAGQYHTCVRRGSAGAYVVTCWGDNARGQLGLGSTSGFQLSPGANVIGLPSDLVGLSTGTQDATCVRTSGGSAWCWGNAANGNILPFLGVGTLSTPAEIAGHTGIVELVLGQQGACFRRTGASAGTFEVWCWGPSSVGWIDGSTAFGVRETPVRTPAPSDSIALMVGQSRWCVARGSTSGVTCMGLDDQGSLGDGGPPDANRLTPTAVLALP